MDRSVEGNTFLHSSISSGNNIKAHTELPEGVNNIKSQRVTNLILFRFELLRMFAVEMRFNTEIRIPMFTCSDVTQSLSMS